MKFACQTLFDITATGDTLGSSPQTCKQNSSEITLPLQTPALTPTATIAGPFLYLVADGDTCDSIADVFKAVKKKKTTACGCETSSMKSGRFPLKLQLGL
jgi:hypothetical protein